jgi:hypothetical protein
MTCGFSEPEPMTDPLIRVLGWRVPARPELYWLVDPAWVN